MPRRSLAFLRRVPFETWLSLAALVAAAAMLWRPLEFFLRRPGPVAFDDGYTVAFAERIIDQHWLPYVDACSHRGPLLYWVVALGQTVFGRFGWLGARNLSFVLWYATLAAVFLAALAARRRLAGGIGALLLVWLACVYDVPATWGVGGESISAPLVVLALALTATALERVTRLAFRTALLALAGCVVALAGLAKQTALPAVAPLLAWTLAVAWTEHRDGRRRGLLPVALAGGFALPILLVLARYALAGHLSTFWYWYYRYNAEVYMAPHRNDSFRTVFDRLFDHRNYALLGLALGVMVALLSRVAALGPRPWHLAREYAKAGFDLTLVWLTLLALAGALAPLRFFFHYFLPLFPLTALLIGVGVERAFTQAGGTRAALAVASALSVVVVFAITLFANDRLMRGLEASRAAGGWSGVHPEPLCAYLDQHADRDSPLFIWGFDADLYVTCKRRPATRFLYVTLLAGTVPDTSWRPPDPRFVARGSREQLLSDLETSQPPVILEMPGHVKGVGMSAAPEIAQWVSARYCPGDKLTARDGREATAWLRKRGASCNAPTTIPMD